METLNKHIGKKFKLKTSENFDEYLKYIGVGYIQRKIVTSLSPISELKRNEDGTYTLSMSTPVRCIDFTFKIAEEFDETRPDGVKVKSTMIVEDNKLVQTQIEASGRKSTHVREFTNDKLIVITTVDGWDGTCIRMYELIQ